MGIASGDLEDVKGNSLRRLWPNAREPTELVDQVLNRSSKERQGSTAAEHVAEVVHIETTHCVLLTLLYLRSSVSEGRKDEVV